MGFLNQKHRVLDVVLTDRGRELLSKNQLDFSFYAFSDEGVDYSGSLSSSLQVSSSFDDYVHRDLSFEADQRRSDNGRTRRDLDSYLFTIPSRKKVLPEMRTNKDAETSLSLTRSYYVEEFSSLGLHTSERIQDPIASVVRATLEKRTSESRLEDFALDQQIHRTNQRLKENKNVVGQVLSKDFVAISSKLALNIKTGLTKPIKEVQQENQIQDGQIVSVSNIVENVVGLDSVVFDLMLKNVEGESFVSDGFLIEVFESGSDGKIKELFQKTVEDPINDETLQDGYDSFLNVVVDK